MIIKKMNREIRKTNQAIRRLKKYFQSEDSVILAFVFGSRAKGNARETSDWDIAVYLKSKDYGELESKEAYPREDKIRSDVIKILDSDDIDLLVLNRARPQLVFNVLNSGTNLALKDRRLYLKLLIKTHYEAVDFPKFIYDFWLIRERSKSLSEEDRATLIEHLVFLENEFADLGSFQKMTWKEYQENHDMRRSLERLIENLIMASLDISKIILSSQKKEVPHTYTDTLKVFGEIYFDSYFADEFSKFAEFRNIVAHEYLDIRWSRIQNFMKEAPRFYEQFIKKVKQIIKK